MATASEITASIDPGLPVAESQLESIAAIAHVRGLSPRDIDQARVLEIGCGAGANLLMMAECRPGSRFFGLDVAPAAIELAKTAVAELGLGNIEFQEWRGGGRPDNWGQFDYVICRGAYSRSSVEMRQAILQACKESLAEGGIALVGYDTFPGWSMLEMLRRMMIYEARGATEPAEMVARGRVLLEFLKRAITGDKRPYDRMIIPEVNNLLALPDGQLYREYLCGERHPTYFGHFLADARAHGLAYLGDALVGIRYTDRRSEKIERTLSELESDELKREHLRDILTNRTARQTLLCHPELQFDRELSSSRLERLFFESRIWPEDKTDTAPAIMPIRFAASNGARLTTGLPLLQAALFHLGQVWPEAISLEDLLNGARERCSAAGVEPGIDSTADRSRLLQSLLPCCASRAVEVLYRPHIFRSSQSERPVASPLARWLAARGTMVVNRKHQPLSLNPIDHAVLKLLDGTRDAVGVREALIDAVRSGTLAVSEGGQTITDPGRLNELLNTAKTSSLAGLALNALLIG